MGTEREGRVPGSAGILPVPVPGARTGRAGYRDRVQAALVATVVVLGFLGAGVSGMLGVGGAIVMIPTLLYVPPLLGLPAIDVKDVAAATLVQVLVATLSGMLAHRRHQLVDPQLALYGGVSIAVGALAGGVGSRFVSGRLLLVLFAIMAAAAAGIMIAPPPPEKPSVSGRLNLNQTVLVVLAGGTGVFAGMVGSSGGFILIPLMIYLLKVPTRVAIGSSLAIALAASVAGFVGKAVTGQVPIALSLALVLGAWPGAQVGARISRWLDPRTLRCMLTAVISITAARVWYDILSR